MLSYFSIKLNLENEIISNSTLISVYLNLIELMLFVIKILIPLLVLIIIQIIFSLIELILEFYLICGIFSDNYYARLNEFINKFLEIKENDEKKY